MKYLIVILLFSQISLADVGYDPYYSKGQPVSCGGDGQSIRPAQPPLIDVPSGSKGPLQALGLRSFSSYLDESRGILSLQIGMAMTSCIDNRWFDETPDQADYQLLVAYHGAFSDARFRQPLQVINRVNMETGDVRSIPTALYQIPLDQFLSSKMRKKYEKGESVTVKMTSFYAFKKQESKVRSYFPAGTYENDLEDTYLYGAGFGFSITLQRGTEPILQRN